MTMKLLIATTNPGKLEEYTRLLTSWNVDVLSLADVGLGDVDVEEDGKTFKENAIKKARFYCEKSGLATLSDDGGLEIEYLGGEPGVHSRRWPGYRASDEELMLLAIEKLKGVPWEKRRARFVVETAFAFPKDDGVYVFNAVLAGYITEEPAKSVVVGYPFRSVFYVSELAKRWDELTREEEERVSHRRRALAKAKDVALIKLKA